MSDNGIRIEVKLYKGKEKIFIRKHFENLIKGKSPLRTKSLDIDEWVELKKAAQSIDNQLCKLNLTKQSTELTETIESTSLTSHSEEQIRHIPSTPLKHSIASRCQKILNCRTIIIIKLMKRIQKLLQNFLQFCKKMRTCSTTIENPLNH